VRYLSDDRVIDGGLLETNVMPYGYEAGESGHTDLRLVLPKGVGTLRDEVERRGLTVPSAGDFAFLEWPTASDPTFKLSLLDPNSSLTTLATQLLAQAEATGQTVGRGAAWLPSGVIPTWGQIR
jgi:hypothetical protein